MSHTNSFRDDKIGNTFLGIAILLCLMGFARLYMIHDDNKTVSAEPMEVSEVSVKSDTDN